MPKQIDHDQRRAELLGAAVDLVARGGRSAASVRAIAGVTGWSVGAVRHYLPSTAALESLLLDHVAGRVQARVARTMRTALTEQWPRADLVAGSLEQVLPLDAEREVEHRIWIALYVDDPTAAHELAWVWTGRRMFHRQLVLLLGGAEAVPNLPGPLREPLERWAAHLHAFADGLALRVAAGIDPVPRAKVELRDFVSVVAQAAADSPGRPTAAPGSTDPG